MNDALLEIVFGISDIAVELLEENKNGKYSYEILMAKLDVVDKFSNIVKEAVANNTGGLKESGEK